MTLFKQYRGLRKELYILFFGRVMTNMGSMIWPIFTLILNKKLGYNAASIAYFTLIFTVVALPVIFIGGKLADKFNKRNIIVICDLISIGGYIACSLMEISLVSIIIYLLSALFQSMENPSYESLVADFTTSKDRTRAYSLSYLGSNLGLVLAPTIGGFLFNDYLYLAFLINGIAIACSTILIFLFIKNVEKEKDDSIESEYEKKEVKGNTFKYILSNRVIVLFLIVSALGSTVYSMYNYLMPLDLTRVYADNGSVIFGTMCSVNSIIVVAFTSIITTLTVKIKDIDKTIIGRVLIVAGYIIFLLLIKVPLFCYVAITIFTFGEIVNTIAEAPLITRRIPATHRGRIMSITNIFCSVVSATLQIAVGSIFDNYSNTYAWLFIFAIALIEIILTFIMRRFDKKMYNNLY